MLRYPLTHPKIISALAAAGHGSKVLLADGNYPHATGVHARTNVVYLNLRPGLIEVNDALATLLTAINVEAATVMRPDEDEEPAVFGDFRQLLPRLRLEQVDRSSFYRAASAPEVTLALATGEQRLYANILLTIGVVAPPS